MTAPRSSAPELVNDATRLRILVVDNNSDCAETTATLLGMYGHEVRTAGNGLDAVTAVVSHQFDVVVLDVRLPGITGHDLAQWIRRQPREKVPYLIAMTGYGDEATRQKSNDCGIDLHLLKPVDPQYLVKVLADLKE